MAKKRQIDEAIENVKRTITEIRERAAREEEIQQHTLANLTAIRDKQDAKRKPKDQAKAGPMVEEFAASER